MHGVAVVRQAFGRHLGSVSGFGMLAKKCSPSNRIDFSRKSCAFSLRIVSKLVLYRVRFPYSPKRRRHRVPDIKLVVRVLEALSNKQKSATIRRFAHPHYNSSPEYKSSSGTEAKKRTGKAHPPQIPNNLIQRRRKSRINIKKQTIRLSDLERPPQVRDDGLEAARRADGAALAARGYGGRRPAHGLEPHDDLVLGEGRAHLGQRRSGIARELREHQRGCHRQGQVR